MNGIMCCVIVIASGSGIETQTKIAKFETYQIQYKAFIRSLKYKGQLPEIDTSPNSSSKIQILIQ